MATETEIQAGAEAIALNCASVNCLRFLADNKCAMRDDCCCRQDAKLAIEAAEKARALSAINP
jgi:hypothetical protein